MEGTTNQSIAVSRSNSRPREVCSSNTDEIGDGEVAELTNYETTTYIFNSRTNAVENKAYQNGSMADCKPNSQSINTNVDPKLQAIAQLFVHELLLRASEEASHRINRQSEVTIYNQTYQFLLLK